MDWKNSSVSTRESIESSMNLSTISICIITFRRPQSLSRLLNSLLSLFHSDCYDLEIVVVDNDKMQSALSVIEAIENQHAIRYFVEPIQNIALARNRAIREAKGEWIAFIDDDEIPGDRWLKAYVEMSQNQNGDGYFGPVMPITGEDLPTWLDRKMISRDNSNGDGSISTADLRTGNCFIKRALFENCLFDRRFGLTGGEDSELFQRMLLGGASFLWCSEAITFEYFPPDRLRLVWFLQRAFRGGFTYTLINKKHNPQAKHQLIPFLKALGGSVVFPVMLPFFTLTPPKFFQVLRRFMMQLGHIWAFVGLNYEEYNPRRRE